MTRDTPKYGHGPIDMVRRRDWDELGNVGEFCWKVADGKRVLYLAVPFDIASGYVLSRWTIDHYNSCGAMWSWDGNEDAPTLTPSLHAVGVWHGWVRYGQLLEA